MMRIFLIFLATFIIFVGIALNYAKAFRVKNKIIDIIEQNEGILDIDIPDTDESSGGPIKSINNYLQYINYDVVDDHNYVNSDLCSSKINNSLYNVIYYSNERGYCIGRYIVPEDERHVSSVAEEYYEVVTFVIIKIPMFDDLVYPIPIRGETRKIERIENS